MELSTRLVSLALEMVFVPSTLDEKKCREIFDKISDSHTMASYQSLQDGTVLMTSKEAKQNITRYRIAKDRIVINYDQCSQSINYYQALLDDFTAVFSAVTGTTFFIMHSVVVRKLANIKGFEDGRAYLAKNVLSLSDDKFKPFGRPLHVIGTRMFFPPVQEDPTAYDIKIDSLMEDYKTLFIECAGIYSKPVDIKQDKTIISSDITKTDDFINKNAAGFLGQFADNKI